MAIFPPNEFNPNAIVDQLDAADGTLNAPQASVVPIPRLGLSGNSNYFFYSPGAQPGACGYLTGVSITISLTEDIAGSDGFSFQLNAYGKKGDPYLSRQYVVRLAPNSKTLVCQSSAGGGNSQAIAQAFVLATLPGSRLPAGYKLTISLGNATDAAGGGVTSTYTLVDGANVLGTRAINFGASVLPLAVAFQVNLVGPSNGAFTELSSGAGTITCEATVPLSISNTWPACVQLAWYTVENANSIYGTLRSDVSKVITQAFGQAMASLVSTPEATPGPFGN